MVFNAFDLLFGVVAMAAITSWFAIRNAKETGILSELTPEILFVSIAWLAALLVGLWVAVIG